MWPSDLDYGIFGFEYDGKPCGGKIKKNPEDFKVIEIDNITNSPLPEPPIPYEYHGKEGGLFFAGRIWRRGHDHSKMIRQIKSEFKVNDEQISTAGVKDAKAEIVQLFSVYDPNQKFKKNISDPKQLDTGMEIDSFHYRKERLYPGNHAGNHFVIKIRDYNSEFTEDHLVDFNTWIENNNILNYYGYQRFGSYRPITAKFGKQIALKNYAQAIDIYLGGKSARSDEQYRAHWREHHDPEQLLLIWDNIPAIESEILKYLVKKPDDYAGAIRYVPDFLINIAKSAFVSLLFNNYLSRRGKEDIPLKGERKVGENIEVALPSNRWEEPLNDIWEEVFEQMEIKIPKELKEIRHTTRHLFIELEHWESQYSDEYIQVKFNLNKGQYATTLLRQLMQQPPSEYF